MSRFPSIPETAHLSDVFKRFPKGVKPLLELHDDFLRKESDISIADRELIAAYVSGLNACQFCYGAHTLMARAFGVEENILEALVADLDTAPVDARLKPLLVYVRTLTLSPSRLTEAHGREAMEAGWSEDALYDAAAICALYNYMNRIVEASGIIPGAEYSEPDETAMERRRNSTYMDWGRDNNLF